ncbi:MAG TPA: DUF6056 family protein [Thermoanaerobaculia bacterium]
MPALRRVALSVATATAALCLASYAVLGWYSRWIADDFCSAARLRAEGFWQSQATLYRTWSGRFAFAFAINAVQSLGPETARVVPAIAVLAWVAATTFAARRVLRVSAPLSLAAAIVFVFAAIDGAPNSFQSLLWQTGALTYLTPLILLTCWIGVVPRANDRREATPLTWLAAAALPFIAGAFSETAVVCQVAAFTVAAVLAPPKKRRVFVVALVASLVCLAIVAAAPGNAVRRANFPASDPIQVTIARTASATYDFIGQALIANFAGLLLACAFAMLVRREQAGLRLPLAALIIAIGTTAAAELTALHSTTGIAPIRAMVIPETFVVIAAIAFGLYATPRAALVASLLTIVLSLAPLARAAGNAELVPAAEVFAEKWDRMDLQLRAAGIGAQRVVDMPASVDLLDFVTRNPAYWSNRCIAGYYDLSGVRSR